MNVYYERLKVVKQEELLSPERLILAATVFLTWGKITEAQYDEIVKIFLLMMSSIAASTSAAVISSLGVGRVMVKCLFSHNMLASL